MNLEIFNQLGGTITGFIMGLIAFIVIFIPAVCIHEFGHLLIARLCGVRVPEYAIGMPFSKRLFYFRKFGIIWSFYPILLGGFVRLYGDNDAIENAFENKKEYPKTAKQDYVKSRFDEIIASQMLEFFVLDNGLEYDQKWKNLEKYNFEKEAEIPEDIKKQRKQMETLIGWEYDKEINAKDTLFSKNWLQQTAIIMGGIIFNLITAVICYVIIFSTIILPKSNEIQPYQLDYKNIIKFVDNKNYAQLFVVPGGLLDKNGITKDTKIYELGGQKILDFKNYREIAEFIKSKKGQDIEIKFDNSKNLDPKIETKTLKLENMLGIGGAFIETKIDTKDNNPLVVGTNFVSYYSGENLAMLGKIGRTLIGLEKDTKALDSLGGPVGASNQIANLFSSLERENWARGYLEILAQVSIALAVFNILPIPALDGGRWVILSLIKLTGRRNRKLENTVISLSFIVLMGLGVFLAFKDSWNILFKK